MNILKMYRAYKLGSIILNNFKDFEKFTIKAKDRERKSDYIVRKGEFTTDDGKEMSVLIWVDKDNNLYEVYE